MRADRNYGFIEQLSLLMALTSAPRLHSIGPGRRRHHLKPGQGAKYDGAALRAIRAERGVGRPPRPKTPAAGSA